MILFLEAPKELEWKEEMSNSFIHRFHYASGKIQKQQIRMMSQF